MDTDIFAQMLQRKACDADNRDSCENITLDLIRSKPVEQNWYWWVGRGVVMASDRDTEGLHLSQNARLSMRWN